MVVVADVLVGIVVEEVVHVVGKEYVEVVAVLVRGNGVVVVVVM